MDDFTSGKRNGKEVREANLRPIQPGEVRNLDGTNQYTYKRDFERTIDALLKGGLSPEEVASVPDWVQDLIAPGMKRGEALAAVTVAGALRGGSRHLAAVLKRIWPKMHRHRVADLRENP